jgi:hypothetical protein
VNSDALEGRKRWSLKMQLKAEIVSTQMHLEAGIARDGISMWRPRSSELTDAVGGHNPASLEIHPDAENK